MDTTAPARFYTNTRAVVITTAMLSFISSWQAAAIVLCDLASSAYYACGIAEQSVGKAAPWFILAIMIFSLALRMVFAESCTLFVRGGVYRTVKAALGKQTAKVAVSAILFDYILTGPISAVSAAHYLAKFLNQSFVSLGYGYIQLPEWTIILIAATIIAYFWRNNIIGIHESSTKSLRIVQLTTVMIVLLIGWSLVTLALHPQPLPPFTPRIQPHALGWLSFWRGLELVPSVALAIALGHSLLAMSGEEALSQVYRELAAPKIRNLRRAALIIFAYSFLLTGVVSLFSVMLIPDAVRPEYNENLLSGLTMFLAGPELARLCMQAFVVTVGILILSGACNTAIVGGNGALNRLAEDSILPQWLRRPHGRYGTTSRTIHIFSAAQIVIVIASRGDVYLLGEAYAFGVLWCFVFQTLAVLVLRFRDRREREYRVPLNLTIGRTEWPIGIGLILACLLVLALTNFTTKTTATTYGLLFTGTCFIGLTISERINRRHADVRTAHLEQVNLAHAPQATADACGLVHEHRILCAVRDPNNLVHLAKLAKRIDPQHTDLVTVSVKQGDAPIGGSIDALPLEEQRIITSIVATAERYGVPVVPLLIPADDPVYAIAKAAFDLQCDEIVVGRSGKSRPEIQLEKLAIAWGHVSAEHPRPITMYVIWPQNELKFQLG